MGYLSPVHHLFGRIRSHLGSPAQLITWQELLLVALFFTLILAIQYSISDSFSPPTKDALRYSDYAVNIVQHGTFGLTDRASPDAAPYPGNANGPIYPLFIAAVAALNDPLFDSLSCAVANPKQTEECPEHYDALALAQYAIALISLLLLWASAQLLFRHRLFAVLTTLFAALSMVYAEKALEIETENLILPLFILVQLSLMQLLIKSNKRWAFTLGVALGLLTLTRPEYLYLGLAIGILWTGIAIFKQDKHQTLMLLCAALAFLLSLAPWSLRNQNHFDSPALSGGNYGEIILSCRLSFNRMTATEWAAAFVYWLPDFGDKLAAAWLPEASYAKLISTRNDSYLATAHADILQPAMQSMNPDAILGHLIKTEILGRPLQHALVTLPLIWRGAFVAKYWGLIGLVGYLSLLIYTVRQGNWLLLQLSAPAWFMVAFHAAISINIPRYNLPLVSLYALGWGWFAYRFLRRYWKIPSMECTHDPAQ